MAAGRHELANAILLSAWEKQPIELPIDRDRFKQAFSKRHDSSELRKKVSLDVTIDMSKSYR